MKRVLLRYYNADNLGDDLFVKLITNRYRNTFTLYRDIPTRAFRGIGNLKIRGNRVLNRIYRNVGSIVQKNNLHILLRAKRYDFLVYIGGSIFIEKDNLNYWLRERDFYKGLPVPYYILGSNYGPQQSAAFKGAVRAIVSGAKDVCFRDEASYRLFEDVSSARLATDIVFTMDVADYAPARKNKTAVFSIINGEHKFNHEMVNKYELEIVNLAKKMSREGYRIVLMSFCKYEGDEMAIERVLDRMGAELRKKISTYFYDGNIDEALNVLMRSEIVIASRFHAAIIGLVFGKKVLPIAYSDKTINILKDIRFKGPVVDIRKIDTFDGEVFDFASLELNDVSAQSELAEKQFQELDKVLEKRV